MARRFGVLEFVWFTCVLLLIASPTRFPFNFVVSHLPSSNNYTSSIAYIYNKIYRPPAPPPSMVFIVTMPWHLISYWTKKKNLLTKRPLHHIMPSRIAQQSNQRFAPFPGSNFVWCVCVSFTECFSFPRINNKQNKTREKPTQRNNSRCIVSNTTCLAIFVFCFFKCFSICNGCAAKIL